MGSQLVRRIGALFAFGFALLAMLGIARSAAADNSLPKIDVCESRDVASPHNGNLTRVWMRLWVQGADLAKNGDRDQLRIQLSPSTPILRAEIRDSSQASLDLTGAAKGILGLGWVGAGKTVGIEIAFVYNNVADEHVVFNTTKGQGNVVPAPADCDGGPPVPGTVRWPGATWWTQPLR